MNIDEPINRCWVCGATFADGDGFDVADTGEELVCGTCWHAMPEFHRFICAFVTREQDRGGLGLRELVRLSVSVSLGYGRSDN